MIANKIIASMIEQTIVTKFKISLSKGVKVFLGAVVNFAIFPNTVESPVDTTISALPAMQCVPCKPIHFVSR